MDLIRCPKVLGKIFGPPGVCRVLILGSQREQFTALNFLPFCFPYLSVWKNESVQTLLGTHAHHTHTFLHPHVFKISHMCMWLHTNSHMCVNVQKKKFKKSPPDFFQYSERTIGSTETNNSSKERSDAQFFWSLKDYGMAISVVCYFNLPLKHRSANSLI